ncbi:hypothetical protein N658DRAFT_489752 [Parathielavia hyrcaniae]|uniref:Uncharacterized protein n=1 Tax=Parathielavia hyrcaniae TaxID=113614 RepID=A0AAN6PV92_9PEZI|nr:hypothetical protein N658DRAFT_489752 [Parathielavia hyrcaniae]
MKFGLSPLGLTSLVMLLSCNTAVKANFDLYSGWVNIIGGSGQHHYSEHWTVFGSEPNCDQAWGAKTYGDTDDVSGDKTGVRCRTNGCHGQTNPHNIEVLEMHFSNNPLYHWTIYNDRGNYDMIGLDGRVYGNCDPFPGDDYLCTYLIQTISGVRKFRCYTQFTAGQINSANRLGLTLDEAVAKYNVTGWEPVTRKDDLE